MQTDEKPDHLTLKWGTLKAWRFGSQEALALLRQYAEIGLSAGAMQQRDTPEQKRIICQLIDECRAPEIYLDWDDKYVSKDEAKRYVMDYGKPKTPEQQP